MLAKRSVATAAALAVVMAACQPADDFPAGDAGVAPDSPAAVPDPVGVASEPAAPDPGSDPPRPVGPRGPETAEAAPPVPTTPAAAPDATGDCTVPAPGPAAGERRVAVFFSCRGRIREVGRIVGGSPAVLRSALEELLRGPTATERAAGFHSFFSDATAGAVRSVVIGADGIARIDFDDFSAAIPNASSSAGSTQLLAQLRATIFQYPTVRAADITFQGSCERFWEWLQRPCARLERP